MKQIFRVKKMQIRLIYFRDYSKITLHERKTEYGQIWKGEGVTI